MHHVSEPIRTFFQEFEDAGNNFDLEASVEQFSETFMHADPSGVRAVPRNGFLQSLPKRKAYFDAIGLRKTRLEVVEEIPLNAVYTLAKVAVTMDFVAKNGESKTVPQTASYIVKMGGDTPQIVFYLNDQMLQEVMASHGLAPTKA